MIIGVDESGDFRVGSRAFIVAVFIRPSRLDELESAHRAWERNARRALGLTNEIKGASISPEWASRWIEEVAIRWRDSPIRYQAHAVDVSDSNLKAMSVQRSVLVEGLREQAVMSSSPGSWLQLAEWLDTRPAPMLLKLMTLTYVVAKAFEIALPLAIAGQFDRELEHLAVRIDRGYVRTDQVSSWREILRNVLLGHSQAAPFVFSSEWDDTHPFMRKFVDRPLGDGYVLTAAFKNCIDFHDSTRSTVVRMADIVASAIRRGAHGTDMARVLAALGPLSADHAHSYELVEWTDQRRHSPNPFLSSAPDAAGGGPQVGRS